MDKPEKGNTITIKINGKESSFKAKEKEHPINEKQQEPSISDQVEKEAAAAKESTEEDEQFDWVLPTAGDLPEVEEDKSVLPEKKKGPKRKMEACFGRGVKRKKLSTKDINLSMVLAVFFAVVLGAFFGLLLLKVVPS